MKEWSGLSSGWKIGRVIFIAAAIWFLIGVLLFVLGLPGGTQRAQAYVYDPGYGILYPTTLWNDTSKNGGSNYWSAATVETEAEVTEAGVDVLSARRGCRQVSIRKWVRNRVGNNHVGLKLFGARMSKYWCWARGRVTYHPKASVSWEVTGLGNIGQWDAVGVVDRTAHYFRWRGRNKGGHVSAAKVAFERCIPSPWGCIRIESADIGLHIRAHGDGSYWKD